MANNEIKKYLFNLKLENDIYPVDEQTCREENPEALKNIEKIFDLKNSSDYTCLFAIAELMADDDKVEEIKQYLVNENSFSAEVPAPDWDTKVLVVTGMTDNPLFFSMAYNWVSIIENRVAAGSNKNIIYTDESVWKTILSDKNVERDAASSQGFEEFGPEFSLGKYGKIGQEGSTDPVKALFFYIKLSKECQSKILSFSIDFETITDKRKFNVIINKKTEAEKAKLKSKTVDADITKGIRIIKVAVKEK